MARHGWRKLGGIALLMLWTGWMMGAFAAIRPVAPARPPAALPVGALDALHARLRPIDGATLPLPLAARLPASCACAGDDASWAELAAAVARLGGTSVSLDAPVSELGGHDVVVLGVDGTVRYAGPLQPLPSLCGDGPPQTRLARWLPALLAAPAPMLADARDCRC